VGFYDRMYGGRGVKQGDRLELPEAPNDGMWIAVEGEAAFAPATDSAPETAPVPETHDTQPPAATV
jgi:hypothetical protein